MDVKVHVFTNISNSSRAEHNRMTSKATYLKRRGLNRLKYPGRVTVCPWHKGKAISEESTRLCNSNSVGPGIFAVVGMSPRDNVATVCRVLPNVVPSYSLRDYSKVTRSTDACRETLTSQLQRSILELGLASSIQTLRCTDYKRLKVKPAEVKLSSMCCTRPCLLLAGQ